MTKITNRENLYFLPLFPLALLLALTVYWYFEGYLTGQQARVIVSALGVLATVSLVSESLGPSTLTTIRQNRKTIEDLERDRLKPIYRDLIREIVVAARNNISNVEWSLENAKIMRNAFGDLHLTEITPLNLNPVLQKKFGSEFEETYVLMEEIDGEISAIKELAIEISEDLESTFVEVLEDIEANPEPEPLSKKVVSPGLSVRSNNYTDNYWDAEQEQIINILFENHYEHYYEFRLREHQLHKKLDKLNSDLITIEEELRTEYGIPIESPESILS